MKRCAIPALVLIFACLAVGCGGGPAPAAPPAGVPAHPETAPEQPAAGKEPSAPKETASPETTPPKPPERFEVALYASETICRMDYPIEVTVVLRNISKDAVQFDRGINFPRGFRINEVPKGARERGQDSAYEQPLAIPPGGFVGFRCDLGEYFQDFASPGHYSVAWSDPDIGQARPVEIEVTEYALVVTDFGDFDMRLMPPVAPDAVEQFKRLVNQGFYDGALVSGIQAEKMAAFSPSENSLKEFAGRYPALKRETNTEIIGPGDVVVARQLDIPMLNRGLPERPEFLDSGTPSFFVQLMPAEPTGIKYTVFGRVFRGLDVLYSISRARAARNSQGQPLSFPAQPIRISRIIMVDKPSQVPRRINPAPTDAVPEAELALVPPADAFTYGEPINLQLSLRNPYDDTSLALPFTGLKKGLRVVRIEQEGTGENAKENPAPVELNPDFLDMLLPVSGGLLAPGAQAGIRLDITDICQAFQQGGKFEITWEVGGIKTKPIVIQIQKSLFANITTSKGALQVLLFPQAAPLAVERFRLLAEQGFYENLPFCYVLNAPALALVQSGGKTGDPMGKAPGLPDMPLEPSNRPFKTGTVAFAHTAANPDTGSSQYFIVTNIRPDGAASLFRKYTIIGEVISAWDTQGKPLDYLALLSKLKTEDKIIKIEISEKKTQ